MATPFLLPPLSLTMQEAILIRWFKQEGEPVQKGEALVELQADKATVEVESPAEGTFLRVCLQPGSSAPVGAILGWIGQAGEVIPEDDEAISAAPVGAGSARTVAAVGAAETEAATVGRGPRRVSPVARRLAAQHSLDLTDIAGTGPGGAIVEADVRRALEARDAALTPVTQPPSPPPSPSGERATRLATGAALPQAVHPASQLGEGDRAGARLEAEPSPSGRGQGEGVSSLSPHQADEEVLPLTPVHRVMAERVALSRRTLADVTTVAEVDMTEVRKLRARVPASYTAYVGAAVVASLGVYPMVNSSFVDDHIVRKKRVHLGIAVATPQGLLVPVVRNAAALTLRQIHEEVERLAEQGRAGNLTLEDLSGATFTITNSGVFGSLLFTPVIDPPQAATLGMGKIMATPVVRDGQIVARDMMYLCLSYDHRVLDGATAVQFLQKVKAYLEDPVVLLWK